jgi:hypothetical protein
MMRFVALSDRPKKVPPQIGHFQTFSDIYQRLNKHPRFRRGKEFNREGREDREEEIGEGTKSGKARMPKLGDFTSAAGNSACAWYVQKKFLLRALRNFAVENSDVDPRDADFQLRLAVADLLVIPLAPAVFDGVDLLPFDDPDDIPDDRRARDRWNPDAGISFTADQEHAVKRDIFVFGCLPVDANDIAGCYLVLPSTVINDRVHQKLRLN